MGRKRFFFTLVLFVNYAFLFGLQKVSAQMGGDMFRSEECLDTACYRQLSLEIDNLSFYKNNEYNSTFQKGYTLPGFWLQLKALYYPLENLKLEAGAHSIWFWGASRYPGFAYRDIPVWGGMDYSHKVHVLPFLRASVAFSKKALFVMGNIYGGSNHGLIEPLYNTELDLTSDPEAGFQFLYRSRRLDVDAWLDWITFIYRLDTHQESFITGLSTTYKVNPEVSPFHLYFRFQGLTQHRGGEIDISRIRNYTALNGALGVGVRWNLNGSVLKYMNVEADYVGYIGDSDNWYPIKSGYGLYSKLAVQLQRFNVVTAYWTCKNYLPLLANPFYGAASTKIDGMYYHRPEMLYLGIDYVCPLGEGFSFGVHGSLFYFLSGKMYAWETGVRASSSFGSNQNCAMGVFMRINPSFLLKRY